VRALASTRLDRRPVQIVEESVRISVWAVLGAWLVRRLFRLLVWLFRTPAALIIMILVVAGVYGWRHVHPAVALAPAGLLMAGLGLWLAQWPDSFDRWVWFRVRGCWRAAVIYRWRCSKAITGAGLNRKRHDTEYLPQPLRVRSTRSVDRVRVQMLPGQTLHDYATVADRLGQTFGTLDCRIRSVPGRVHELELWLLTADPLAQIVDLLDPVPEPLTAGLSVALAEDGTVWRLPLLGTHVLVVGATGGRERVGDLVYPHSP
jgi:S-DNA-T family DNA segregation ATPase FtsK/SpoIIIE